MTLGELKRIAERYGFDDETEISVAMEPRMSSIPFIPNVVMVTQAEHSYGKKDSLSLVPTEERPSDRTTVRVLVDKNTWKDEE